MDSYRPLPRQPRGGIRRTGPDDFEWRRDTCKCGAVNDYGHAKACEYAPIPKREGHDDAASS